MVVGDVQSFLRVSTIEAELVAARGAKYEKTSGDEGPKVRERRGAARRRGGTEAALESWRGHEGER
jgi:hypothetical protein